MKKQHSNILTLSSILISLTLCSCAGNSSSNEEVSTSKKYAGKTLTIYNCDDYIASGDEDYEDLIANFENEYGCKVNYYTYDTNETMYNQFTLQKEGTYDLICTSDYMIQKMIKEKLIEPFDDIAVDVPYYDEYASTSIRKKLQDMKVNLDGEVVNLDQYAVGYMWGTLGLIYDSQYTDTIQEDIKSWDILWDETYKNVISLKNSMRDTYVVGLMHSYAHNDKHFQELKEAYLTEDATKEDLEAYNQYIQQIFDFDLSESEDADSKNKEKILTVKEELISVKNNIFGFEVDSGKNDIITGKIKINLAWSGDAVYSIDTALEERDGELLLEYYVPDDGGNIWFDGWTLPKGAQREMACDFLNYISSPESAAINMDYIGYTPFIGGDEIFDLATNWYGIGDYSSTYEYTYDEEEETQDLCIYNNKLYRCIQSTEGDISPEDSNYWEEAEFDSSETYYCEDMVSHGGKIYECISEDENGVTSTSINNEDIWLEVEPYDLSYLFSESIDSSKRPVIFPYSSSLNQLQTQYPDEKTTARCGIMNDFGKYNDDVIIMWGQVRAATNMTPFYTIIIVFVILVVALFSYYFIQKKISSRNKRNILLRK